MFDNIWTALQHNDIWRCHIVSIKFGNHPRLMTYGTLCPTHKCRPSSLTCVLIKVSAAIVFWHLSAPELGRFFARLPELHFVVWWICLGTEAWTDAGIVPMSSESRRTTNLLSTETWMWEATPFSASLNNHFKGIKTRFEGNYWQGCLFLDKSSISESHATESPWWHFCHRNDILQPGFWKTTNEPSAVSPCQWQK